MNCYDEHGEYLGMISCFPKEGEEHVWYDREGNCVYEGVFMRYEEKNDGNCLKAAIFSRLH
jgi:hypothetical protein